MKSYIAKEFGKSMACLQTMAADPTLAADLVAAVEIATEALRSGNKLLFAGNGGSAADAQHWAGELVSRFYFHRSGLSAIALTTDSSVLTAISNDYGFEHVFSRQVEALGQSGDVLVVISTSGRSPNILRAIAAAQAKSIKVIGFSGESGGDMAAECDLCFRVPSSETPRIQEGHELLGHLFCALIEAGMFPEHER